MADSEIDELRNLANRAESAIDSIQSLLLPSPNGNILSNGNFYRCPFNSNHLVPPQSLFRHSLRCSSAPNGQISDLGFLESLRYTKTVQSEEEIEEEKKFLRSLPESETDLCFSIDELDEIGGNFFFKDCPGVYSFPEFDFSAKSFALPRILALECANFVSVGVKIENFKILPSEFWGFKREIENWKEIPVGYSYFAVLVVSCLGKAKEFGFRKWVLSLSPEFGIMIDSAMADHVYVLLKLCLKAIWREGSSHFNKISSSNENYECPCLSEVVSWLALQLGILYGEINGKKMAVRMIIECLNRAGLDSVLFSLEEDDDDVAKMCSGNVYVAQIAAAVAALHERAMIEERVNQLRFPRMLSKDQLLKEVSFVSMRAQEERAKRPDYRPILEFDGLFFKKSLDQDNTRTKTKEELLAEERDYKRRRMSYRGKKAKRTPIEVIRDIIEEHMQEISEAGDVGCHISESTTSEISSSVTTHPGNSSAGKPKSKTHDLESDTASGTYDDHEREMSLSRGSQRRRGDMEESMYHQHERSARHRDQERSHDRRSYSHHRNQDEDRRYSSSSRFNNDHSDNSGEIHRKSDRRRNDRQRDHEFRKFDDRYNP